MTEDQQMMQEIEEEMRLCRVEIIRGEAMMEILEVLIEIKMAMGLDVALEKGKHDKISIATAELKSVVAAADSSMREFITASALMENLVD